MSKLSSGKTAHIAKPFVDLRAENLYIEVQVNARNQITGFTTKYKGIEKVTKVTGMNIEKAWKEIELFVAKNFKKK